MKKKLLVAALIALILFGLNKSGVFSAITIFLLVGAIPGTAYSVPPATMLLLSAAGLWIVVMRFAALPLMSTLHINRLARQYLARKERLPKRRFRQI